MVAERQKRPKASAHGSHFASFGFATTISANCQILIVWPRADRVEIIGAAKLVLPTLDHQLFSRVFMDF